MKKISFVLLFLAQVLLFATFVYGYEEGPKDSGNWVYGKILYRDGSKCSNCCGIVFSMEWGGMSENGCTNDDGDYKIYVASKYVQYIYYKGTKVWSGSKSCVGGARIDLIIK